MTAPYLGNPKRTIEVLQKYDFVFQKKYGQNFLIDTHVLDKIIDAAHITKDDFVLEIGPGIGTMTQYLAQAAGKVYAVEIDFGRYASGISECDHIKRRHSESRYQKTGRGAQRRKTNQSCGESAILYYDADYHGII